MLLSLVGFLQHLPQQSGRKELNLKNICLCPVNLGGCIRVNNNVESLCNDHRIHPAKAVEKEGWSRLGGSNALFSL